MLKGKTLHIFTVASTILLTKLTTDLYIPAIVSIQEAFNSSAYNAKLTLNAYMLGFALSIIICAPLSKKFGIKNITLVALATCFVTTTLCAFANSIHSLIFFRFIEAIGAGVGTILGRIIINNKYNYSDRIKIFSLFAALTAASTPTMPIVGGFIDEYSSWRYIFVTIAVITLIVFILVKNNLEDDKERVNNAFLDTIHNYVSLLRNPHFLYIIIVNSSAWCLYFMYLNASPFIFQNDFGLSSVGYSISFGLSSLGFVSGSLSIRHFLKKIDLNKFILQISLYNCLIVSLATGYHLFFEKSLISIIISFTLILITVGALLPTCLTLTLKRFKYCSVDALSLHFFIQILACALFAIASGLIKASTDLKLLILECCFTMILLVFAFINSKVIDDD